MMNPMILISNEYNEKATKRKIGEMWFELEHKISKNYLNSHIL